jgi:hypothetical protein
MEVAGKRETREAARNGATAVGEADSGLKPAEDMHGAPLPISHPKFGASPQVAPEYLSRRGVDWFKRGWGRISGWDGERSLTVALTLFSEGRERFEGRYTVGGVSLG